MKINHDELATDVNPMDKLLAKLSAQQAELNKQHAALNSVDTNLAYNRTADYIAASAAS